MDRLFIVVAALSGFLAVAAGALGAVTAFAFSRVGLHSRRNLALYVTALLFVLAWATSGINGWFYVGNYGVPWFDRQPVIAGRPVTTIFLVLAIVSGLLAGWLHFRMDYTGHTEVENTGRNRVLASTPLLVVASIMVVLEVGSMAKGFVQRYPVYTTGKANLSAGAESGLSRTSCAMADDVLVEADTNAGTLEPVPGQTFGAYGPLGGQNPVGFTPNGVSDALAPPHPVVANPGTVNSDGPPDKPNVGIGFAAGTGGGYGPVGVNGSRVFLPFGLDPARTPVMGSYGENTAGRQGHLGVVPAAAPHAGPAAADRRRRRCDLVLRRGPRVPLRAVAQAAVGCAPAGRQLPGAERGSADRRVRPVCVAQSAVPAGDGAAGGQRGAHRRRRPQPVHRAVVRLHPAARAGAADRTAVPGLADPGADGHRDGGELPVPAAVLQHLGVAELPQYRILPNNKQVVVSSNQWQAAADGGPFLFIQALLRTATVPTYLRDDWYRDWGSIERYNRVVRATQAPNATIEEGFSARTAGAARDRSGHSHEQRDVRQRPRPRLRPATRAGTSRPCAGWRSSPACSASCCPPRHRCCPWCRPRRT